jgi:hypothetical protein
MSDLVSLQNQYDDAWNRHDASSVLSFFTENGKVNLYPPLPGMPPTFDGKSAIASFVEMLLPGFHVTSKNVTSTGNKINWFATVSFDAMRADGIESMDADCEAIIFDGRMTDFNVHFTSESLAHVQAAAATRAQNTSKI